MGKHLITGGIVTYNNEKIIERCIEAILELDNNNRF